MVTIYLDIETESQEKEPRFRDKIITIQYKEIVEGGQNPLIILKEWEKGELQIICEFYEYFKGIVSRGYVQVIGFNLLRFDVPFLIYKLITFQIENNLDQIFETFRKVFWRDLRYCLYPLNNLSFKGLSEEEVAKNLGLKLPEPPSREIPKLYKERNYEKIIKHIESEFEFLEGLNRKLEYELDDIRARYKKLKEGNPCGVA